MGNLLAFFSDAFAIVVETFRNPFTDSSIVRALSTKSISAYPRVEFAQADDPRDEIIRELNDKLQKLVDNSNKLNISSLYKMLLVLVALLTIISLIVAVALSFSGNLNEQQIDIIKACTMTWQTGVGALLGLVGGKASK